MICTQVFARPNITPAVPSIKCQDIKTKLVRFTLANTQWDGAVVRAISQRYQVGSTDSLRNVMEEALLIKRGYEAPVPRDETPAALQLSF